jgi:hypothetical protein
VQRRCRRYTPAMREQICTVLLLLFAPSAFPQAIPSTWKVIKDSRGVCQVRVPPEWVPFTGSAGAAVLHDSSTAIVVVTSQPAQEFKPLPDSLQRVLGIHKEKMFENSPKRVFYQDRTSVQADDANGYSLSVPGRNGTCSCRFTVLPVVPEEIVRKIASTLAGVPE